VLLLPRREEERQRCAEVGVKRVFPQPLNEGAERKDVGGFPNREIFLCLDNIESRHQRLRQALVGRDHGHAGGVALGQAAEQFGFRERRGHARV
jgi:hypothetical protein